MEHCGAEGMGEKRQLEAGFVPPEVKKQWKNPSQVQILENAYAVTPSPSAAMKEELAKLTGLDYKQVQYWFGNRRYIDRHGSKRYRSRNEGDPEYLNVAVVSSPSLSYSSMSLADSMVGTESSSYRNTDMLQPLLPTGQRMSQAEIDTQMPQELQRAVKHVENKLGLPLRADGPILGVEFKPLPPDAFGAPLGQQKASLRHCDGKVTAQQTAKLIKVATSLHTAECCLVAKFSNEGTVVARDVDGLNPDCCPGAVQEYQFFPTQPSWLDSYETIKTAHCPCQGSQSGIDAAKRLDNLFLSSEKMITCNNHVYNREKVHLSGSSGDDNQQIDNEEIMMVGAKKEDPVIPDIGHSNSVHVQGVHVQGGQDVNGRPRGSRENHNLIFNGVDSKNYNKDIVNRTSSIQGNQVDHRHGYNRFVVRPRLKSHSNEAVVSDMSYFSHGSFARPLIAEWNEKEQKAVYFEIDNESTLSGSTGSDSTCSDSFDDLATENGKCDTQTNLVDQYDLHVKENDTRKDQDTQEVMDVDRNVVVDEDETDDEGYNGMEMESKDKNAEDDEGYNGMEMESEDKNAEDDEETTPVSSEHTQ